MNAWIPRIFFYHGVDHLVPTFEAVTVIDGIVCKTSVDAPDQVPGCSEGVGGRTVRCKISGFKQCMVMSQVSVGRRGGSRFTSVLIFGLNLGSGNVGLNGRCRGCTPSKYLLSVVVTSEFGSVSRAANELIGEQGRAGEK